MVSPPRPGVDGIGGKILPSTGLADDQHRQVTAPEALELGVDVEHDGVGHEQRPIAEFEEHPIGRDFVLGSDRPGSLFVEYGHDVAEPDDVAVAQRALARDELAVHPGRVAAAEILHRDEAAFRSYARVLSRDG